MNISHTRRLFIYVQLSYLCTKVQYLLLTVIKKG